MLLPEPAAGLERDVHIAGIAAGLGLPHRYSVAKTMVVNRDAETVTISYEQGGQTIVETWRIVD